MINIYVCGPTVYNTPHIGNLRPVMTFDIYARALKEQNKKFNFINNLTDIDDKIIKKAVEEGVSEKEISERYSKEYFDLLNKFNVTTVTNFPTVTEYMSRIIDFVKKLVDKGHAYEMEGNVWFDVKSIDKYGVVSNQNIENLLNGEEKYAKKNPHDFALWKSTTSGIKFDSPWSPGRPGWHTECVVMANEITKGDQLDIHGGGSDLIFPHHENENAQYYALNNKSMTRQWKQTGQINFDGEKMSKSLGNIISANNFLTNWNADVYRLLIFKSSVTGPIHLTNELLKEMEMTVSKYRKAFNQAILISKDIKSIELAKLIEEWNWAEANKMLSKNLKEFNKDVTNIEKASIIVSNLKLVGFEFTESEISDEDKKLLNEWKKLRENKEFEQADTLREILKNKGIL